MKVLNMPQEVEVWYVLPALRKELAKELKKQGLSQTKIAELLNVTKPAITQYLNKSRAADVNLETIHSSIEESAKRITDGNSVIKELNDLLKLVRDTKLICEIHKTCCDVGECGVCFEK